MDTGLSIDVDFDRFTERAIKSVMCAQVEAQRLGHSFVCSDHLLAGALWITHYKPIEVITDLGLKLDTVREQIERIRGKGSAGMQKDYPFTRRAYRSIQIACNEADKAGFCYIGVEDLVLAIVRETQIFPAREDDEAACILILSELKIAPSLVTSAITQALMYMAHQSRNR